MSRIDDIRFRIEAATVPNKDFLILYNILAAMAEEIEGLEKQVNNLKVEVKSLQTTSINDGKAVLVATPEPWCAIAGLHASRDLERGGAPCDCIHCQRECDCYNQLREDA